MFVKGVRQDCNVSPMLFNLYTEEAGKNGRRNTEMEFKFWEEK